MKRSELIFPRPETLQATAPAEARGISRDAARLLVTLETGHLHARFHDLPRLLIPGDLLVVNESATLPASLPAAGPPGVFILNLSTHYGNNLWLAEPRWSAGRPGPLPLKPGETIFAGGVRIHLVTAYPHLPRLWYVRADGDLRAAMANVGKPIRYGYVAQDYPLENYQTVFSCFPGSAEMPSAAYPFTPAVVNGLERRDVEIAGIILHTGVSSLEVETDAVEDHPLYPEPFVVPLATANAVNRARVEGRRVIAVGTTVVRALESAWDGERVRPRRGFTRLYINPTRGVHAVDGLITGLHDPATSHLAMLYALAGKDIVQSAYSEAIAQGYLWHEFGDSHLILSPQRAARVSDVKARAVA